MQTVLGLSNISFGLNPAARHVLNSVFLHECVEAGLDSAIVHASRIMPIVEDPGRPAGGRARPGLRPAPRGVRPAAAPAGAVRRRQDGRPEGEQARGAARAAGRRAAQAAHHRRRAQRCRVRPGRVAGRREARAADHQRRPAGRHEGGRRAVRLRPDAAAVRAAVRRGDEDLCRAPGAAHREDRRRGQGHDRARHRQGRRARHRQEPGRHHPDQQRLHRGQHRHQAADQRDHRRRRGEPRRRDRDVRPAGEVHRGDEGEPGGDQPARPGGEAGR